MDRKVVMFFFGLCTLSFCKATAQAVSFDWVNQLAGRAAKVYSGNDYKNRSLAVDDSGKVYNVGNFEGIVDFDPGTSTSTLDSRDGRQYVAKYAPTGELKWARQFGLDVSAQTCAIALDATGNIYIGGYFNDAFDMSPDSTPALVNSFGGSDIFILKLDPSGNYLWGKHFGSTKADQLSSITVDSVGNVFATGIFGGNIDFGQGTAAGKLTGSGCFVLSLDERGDHQWVKSFKTSIGYSIALDNEGNVLTVGQFAARTDFDPSSNAADTFFMTPAGSTGSSDIFISKLNPMGEFVWAKQMGGDLQDRGFSIATDGSGAVYTTGVFAGTGDFDPGLNTKPLTSRGASANDFEVFVSKLNAKGEFLWAKQLNGNASNWGSSIAVGKGKALGVYVTGNFRGTTEFYQGADTLDWTATGSEGFLLKLDTSGTFEWVKRLGATNSGSVAVDRTGNVFTSGWFVGNPVDFDPGADTFHVHRIGSIDGFIHKMKLCETSSDTLVESACESFDYKGKTYTESGMYQIVEAAAGCDDNKVTVLHLTIYDLDPEITVDQDTLGTVRTYATYQWLKDGQLVQGATQDKYHVTENGDYQVIVGNDEGCLDTSAIYTIKSVVGLENLAVADIQVYPTVVSDKLYIRAPFAIEIALASIDGSKVIERKEVSELSLKGLASGLYILRIFDLDGRLLRLEKIIKQD